MKKYILILILIFFNIKISSAYVPGLIPKDLGLPFEDSVNHTVYSIIPHFVQIFIRYVAVAAVISLMLAGISYMFSAGEEEKVKKSKNWIMWSLIGVLLSVSAWGIVNLINNLSINN